jgi:hypothetical protein
LPQPTQALLAPTASAVTCQRPFRWLFSRWK